MNKIKLSPRLCFAISKRGYPLEIKRGFFEHHPVGSMMFPLIPYS